MLKHDKDIRRRLAIAEVPKPPADLVHKIKHDIPKHFTSMTAKQVEKKPREASPLWNFWGFSWQLAASILVLVGLTWAVFEAYQSEINQATRVADAAGGVTSVDEFEAQVAEPPGTVRIEGKASVPAAQPAGELKKDQAAAPRQASAPAPAAASPVEFAPEPQPSERQRRNENLQDRSDDGRAKTEGESAAESASLAGVAAADTTGHDPAGAESHEVTAPASVPARAATAPAAPAASTVTLEAVGQKARAAAQEVAVKGLREERIVKVEVRLDSSGKVIAVVVAGERDRAVLEAVASAAKSWTFAEEADAAEDKRLTRTLDVQLRKGN